ncbi:hypothetical protein DFA_09830 [Cavenderia fasciculata]|uniref:Cytochrome b5 heme-binding domain-containing protein n=1 Tax=Cavenderia fasciculata TaxID=261658 RepID=F4QAV1_CACFS|nr:uncharacterized protein DFA_09830 [Cavenderia fasciculata]EGG15010.1 hypothetical protein DFA_09830 [Cavenderia fasciculata]|eukprot:XP_004351730.1 hypothetical protein DFA_09830 [Cavenderia fasciculata]
MTSSSNVKQLHHSASYTYSESTTTKLKIEHTLSRDRPLSHSLNTIADSIRSFTETDPDNIILDQLNKQPVTTTNNNNNENGQSQQVIRIPMCTCKQSKSYPYCDSTHVKFNNETNSSLAPIYLTFENNNNNNNETYIKQQQTNNNNNNNNVKEQQQEQQQINTNNDNNNNNINNNNQNLRYILPSNIKELINQKNYFSLEEISRHNTRESCWMIIQNKVYDITEYIDRHPGGKNALLRFAGKDGSENVQFHSNKMLQIFITNRFDYPLLLIIAQRF